MEEPSREHLQPARRQVTAAVAIALSDLVRPSHVPLVLAAPFQPAGEPPCQPTRDGPEAVRSHACLVRHGVAHQATDAAIAVGKGMDPVEAVMRGRHRQDTLRPSLPHALHHASRFWLEGEAKMEIVHEGRHPLAGGRQVAANLDILPAPFRHSPGAITNWRSPALIVSISGDAPS